MHDTVFAMLVRREGDSRRAVSAGRDVEGNLDPENAARGGTGEGPDLAA